MNDLVFKREHFPDPSLAGREGLVMVGGPVNPQMLLEAYSFGIFPWPQEGLPMLWFCPERRGILEFSELHLARSFKKFLKSSPWRITWNQQFEQVIKECAKAKRPGQKGTWITDELVNAYIAFHRAGFAHSIECWDGDELIGGLYGTFVGGVFSGESMFYLKPNASKFCLWKLIERLQSHGVTWMDAQMVTPHLKALGGKYILRKELLKKLEESKSQWRKKSFTLPA